jgi:hypothetical protein
MRLRPRPAPAGRAGGADRSAVIVPPGVSGARPDAVMNVFRALWITWGPHIAVFLFQVCCPFDLE